MNFEWDEDKSLLNYSKHGISFSEAVMLWEDKSAIIIEAKNLDENRFMLIGQLERRVWSVVFTIRKKKIRLISARRSRKGEIKLYEKEKN